MGIAILLVSKKPSIREEIHRQLDEEGYSTCEASTSEAATQAAAMIAFDLLITDAVLQDLSGRDLANKLCFSQPDLKVMFITEVPREALPFPSSFPKGIDVLENPLDRKDVGAKVRTLLEKGPMWKNFASKS